MAIDKVSTVNISAWDPRRNSRVLNPEEGIERTIEEGRIQRDTARKEELKAQTAFGTEEYVGASGTPRVEMRTVYYTATGKPYNVTVLVDETPPADSKGQRIDIKA